MSGRRRMGWSERLDRALDRREKKQREEARRVMREIEERRKAEAEKAGRR